MQEEFFGLNRMISGKEVSRDVPINENLYTEFVKDFEHTYFKASV